MTARVVCDVCIESAALSCRALHVLLFCASTYTEVGFLCDMRKDYLDKKRQEDALAGNV